MKRRPRRAVPAITLALVLLATCVASVGVVVQHLTGTRELVRFADIVGRLHRTAWDSRWVAVGGLLAVAVGLILLTLAVLPGRAVVLPLTGADGFSAGVTRRGLRGALRDAAQSVEGVHSARVRLRRKKVRVKIRAANIHPTGLAESVCAAVGERVARIGTDPAPRVVVATRGGRVARQSGGVSHPAEARALREHIAAPRAVGSSR